MLILASLKLNNRKDVTANHIVNIANRKVVIVNGDYNGKEKNLRSLMESAKKIGQIAEAEAYAADENATISPNVVNAIIEEGINKLILPKEYGGPQIDFKTFSDMVKTVGYYNLSAAWLTYFFSLHNAWVAFLPKHRMDEIVHDGGLVSDVFAPVGKVEKCDDGFILSGTWNFISGVNYSNWIAEVLNINLTMKKNQNK